MTLAAAIPLILSGIAVLTSLYMALRSKKGDDGAQSEEIGRIKERIEVWSRPEPSMSKWMGHVDAQMNHLGVELRRVADKMDGVGRREAEIAALQKNVDELRNAIRAIEERTLKMERLLAELSALLKKGDK